MIKVLTNAGIFTASNMDVAKAISINAARAGEISIIASDTDEVIVVPEARGCVFSYSVREMWSVGNDALIEKYRNCCFAAYAAEERRTQAAAKTQTAQKSTSKDVKLCDDWMRQTFNHFFGEFVTPEKK